MKKSLILLGCICALSINSALAYETVYVDGENFSYQFDIYNIGERLNYARELQSTFEITDEYRQPFYSAAKRWASIINSNTNKPVRYAVLSYDEYNAAALSLPVKIDNAQYVVTGINAAINNLNVIKSVTDIPIDGTIMLGLGVNAKHPGWAPFTGYHALYHGELPDLNVAIMHEIMHSIGLDSYANDVEDITSLYGGVTYGIFDKNLRIYKGDVSAPFDSSKEIAFQKGWRAGDETSNFDIVNNSPYFDGEETIKVLGGKDNYEEAKQAIIANGGLENYSSAYFGKEYPRVYGLPINPYDQSPIPELSHTELRNSYMSHQRYRNWLTLMEAELALLKDIGYDVDLRKFFGKSYYLNGITDNYTRGFGEWNGTNYTGNPSNVIQAVGMHIYGNNNNITQASDILTNGEGSFGVRIEGVGNTYTLASGSNIISTGKENIALGATWGKDHVINIENGATVAATGEDGIAASFDFGSNMFGIQADTKGSYIHCVQIGTTINWMPDNETQGALVKEFNVSGNLEGEKAAIYISDNAWVKDINIKDGANIKGDIISDWNSVSSVDVAHVAIKEGYDEERHIDKYRQRDINNPEEMLNTNLNFTGSSNIQGNITGENGINNTLIMNNSGIVNFDGETIAVKTLNNNGTLNLSGNVKNVGSIVNLAENSLLSTQNGVVQNVIVEQLNSEDAKLAVDLGDTFTINNASETGKDNANLSLIKADETTAKTLDNLENVELFTNNTLNLTGSANVYYNGNKYEISQNSTNKKVFSVQKDSSTSYELGDASIDSTTGNYIVTENALTKDAGTVKGSEFIVSGKDINVNGHNGLVVDGSQNPNGTILKTGINGSAKSDLTVQNNGHLLVSSEDKAITLGKTGETALQLDKGEVILNAVNNSINVKGAIKGNNNTKDFIGITGNVVSLNETDNVTITTESPNVYLNGVETNTNWIVNHGMLNVLKDSYLSSDGTNSLTFNGCGVNLINGEASDINLASLTLNDKTETQIDVDLAKLTSDRFVFNNVSDVATNENKLEITNVNLLNPNTALTNEKYEIPFASSEYNSQNLVGSVDANINREFLTPIYKYSMSYEDNGMVGNIALNRSNTGTHRDFNPAVIASPVAAQIGGFLTQLNSYDEAFRNMDMYMLMTKKEREAIKFRNKLASTEISQYDDTKSLYEKNAGWFRPYATFEKVNLHNGPRVENTAYGSFFGGESAMKDLGHGWDGMWGAYIGYNGSHQNYDGVSIYQNGGTLGLVGMAYKDNFFIGGTINTGASAGEASTMYGNDSFTMLIAGTAAKTGYNWELADGKFIIQPSLQLSYSFVNTFDYTNSAGVRIDSDPLNAITIEPGIKFIGNLRKGWQPYAGVSVIINAMDKANFNANNVSLPSLSVNPYVKYGVGLRKTWGERFTGFFQTFITNGGRNGVGLQLGFRWAIGK